MTTPLPTDIILHTFTFLDVQTLFRARLINRKCSALTPRSLIYPRLLHWFQQRHQASWMLNEIVRRDPAGDFSLWTLQNLQVPEPTIVRLMEEVAHQGNLPVLRTVITAPIRTPLLPNHTLHHALANAALGGHLPVVRYLHEDAGVVLNSSCWMAAEYNHEDVSEYLHLVLCPFDDNSLAQAACYGHVSMVQWLLERGYGNTARSLFTAIHRTDKRPVLIFLFQHLTTLLANSEPEANMWFGHSPSYNAYIKGVLTEKCERANIPHDAIRRLMT